MLICVVIHHPRCESVPHTNVADFNHGGTAGVIRRVTRTRPVLPTGRSGLDVQAALDGYTALEYTAGLSWYSTLSATLDTQLLSHGQR